MKEIIAFEEPETVVLTLQGKLDHEELEGMFEKWNKKYGPDKKVKVLVDLSKLEEIPPKAREVLRKGGLRFPISRLASFGASTKIKIMAGLIVKMVPSVDSSTFVKTEEEARAWLAEK